MPNHTGIECDFPNIQGGFAVCPGSSTAQWGSDVSPGQGPSPHQLLSFSTRREALNTSEARANLFSYLSCWELYDKGLLRPMSSSSRGKQGRAPCTVTQVERPAGIKSPQQNCHHYLNAPWVSQFKIKKRKNTFKAPHFFSITLVYKLSWLKMLKDKIKTSVTVFPTWWIPMRVCHAVHKLALCLLGCISSLFYELCIPLTWNRCPAMMLSHLVDIRNDPIMHLLMHAYCIIWLLCIHFLSLKVQGNWEPLFWEERLGGAGRDIVLFTSFSNLGILYQCVPNVYLVYLTFKKQN